MVCRTIILTALAYVLLVVKQNSADKGLGGVQMVTILLGGRVGRVAISRQIMASVEVILEIPDLIVRKSCPQMSVQIVVAMDQLIRQSVALMVVIQPITIAHMEEQGYMTNKKLNLIIIN